MTAALGLLAVVTAPKGKADPARCGGDGLESRAR